MPMRCAPPTRWSRTRASRSWSIPRPCCFCWAPRWTTRPTRCRPSSSSTIRTRSQPAVAANPCSSRLRRSDRRGVAMDRDFLIDLFSDFGPVTIRRMFSGFGISADGTNFALALRAGLYFRADEQTIPQFEAEGSKPFQYQTRARTVTVNSYWQLPARLFDDPEELSGWARAALAAAQRAALRKRQRQAKQATVAAKRTSTKKTVSKKTGRASNKPNKAPRKRSSF